MLKPKRNNWLLVIGYGLSLLYGVSFLFYWGMLGVKAAAPHAAIIMILFLALFAFSLGLVRFNETARQLLVAGNAVMFFYFLALFFWARSVIPPSYLFLFAAAVFYFNQTKIRLFFKPDLPFTRKSVLIVDDDEGCVKTVQGVLLASGYSVLTARTGEKGMQIAKLQKPDLILLDVILPGLKGREVCSRLKEDGETRDIPVIFLTAKDSPDDIKAEMAAGGHAHLTKPVNGKILVSEIKRVIG